jgi:trimeric autotransporter adhesin
MTSYVINTSLSNTTYTLVGSDDDLLVAATGSIINTNGDPNVDATNVGESITIDGFVYSVDGGSGTAVEITGASSYLVVNGQVQGDEGVSVNDTAGVSVTVGSQGTVSSVSGYDGIFFAGNSNSPTVTDYSLENAGDIGGAYAVYVEYGGDDFIDNTGEIAGSAAITFYSNVASEAVDNSGTIRGGSSSDSTAIYSYDSSAGIDIINSGLITDGGANATGGNYALLAFGDDTGAVSTIDNEGDITGSGYVIQSNSDVLEIANSGTVHGGLYSTSKVTIANTGTWQASTGSPTVFSLSAAGNSITNAHAGTLAGAIDITGADDTVANAGDLNGTVTLESGDDNFVNAGDIDGAVTFRGSETANTFVNASAGSITGNFSFSADSSALTNAGAITGTVTMAGADTLTNAGQIYGYVDLGYGDSMSNTDLVQGNVALDTDDTLTNHGDIYGNVVLGSGTTLTNTGLIHGNVTLGATDTVEVSPGDVTGLFTASSSDRFELGGNFGTATIADFTAGSATTHDTIQFAANDFGSFSAVQAAMSQVGSDVVIQHGTSDSITLTGATLSNLVAADFAFV